MSELVSIVLPVYNGEKYLCESIDSVIAQTYTNWELLILDDCSTDSSPIISQKYAQKDNRIKYYRNECNLRLPRNLNRGFSLSHGRYLTWTSDDNRYHPEAIEKMVEVLERDSGVQFVFASCRIIDSNGEPIEYIKVDKNSLIRIVGENSVGACFMYTRLVYETVGEYNPDLFLVEDFDYWQRICIRFKADIISEILYDYRLHPKNLTNTMKKKDFYHALEKTLLMHKDGFGKLSIYQNYVLFKSLNKCYQGERKFLFNKYRISFIVYSFAYFLCTRLPNKISRLLTKKKRI